MKWLSALILLLQRALDAWSEHERRKIEKRRQAERDALHAAPADWWRNHFDGRLPDDAKAAAQAPAADSRDHPPR
jgi:hypothetical protein